MKESHWTTPVNSEKSKRDQPMSSRYLLLLKVSPSVLICQYGLY